MLAFLCKTQIFKKNNSSDNNENSFDRHAIAAIKQRRDGGIPLEQVVGHLLKEISRFKFILIHGGTGDCKGY